MLNRVFHLAIVLSAILISTWLIPSPAGAQNHTTSPCLASVINEPINDGLVFPDGAGLPDGSGDATQGKIIYQQRCQACHGQQGIGATSVELVGDHQSLDKEFPTKAVGSYWLAAPTLLAYIQQAMPPQNLNMREPRLSNNESYSVVAYILSLNDLWEAQAPLDAARLAAINMPNRNGFKDSELATEAKTHESASVCMP